MKSLADFDPQAVAEYRITADDLQRVERYLRLLQGLVYTAPQPAYHAVREQASETDDEG